MPEAPTPPEDDKQAREKIALAFGGLLVGGMGAASFACILALAGLQRTDPDAQRAMICFCIALPVTTMHRILATDPIRPYEGSWLLAAISLLGMLSFIIGLCILISTVSGAAATAFAIFSFAMVWLLIGAEERGKKKLADRASRNQN